MALTRTNPATWGTGDKLTSGQANGIDAMIAGALDKRAGQTDTLLSVVSVGAGGRIVDSYASGADANTTYLLSGANNVINSSAITAARTYRLGNTGAITGDRLMLLNPSSFALTVQNDTPSTVITLGPDTNAGADSTWADFIYNGSAWIVWRTSKLPPLLPVTFTAVGTTNWTCPAGVTAVLLDGWGGGGGGGSGANGQNANAAFYTIGGGGGGGALRYLRRVNVTPGSVYAVVIQTAAVGGGGFSAGQDGFDVTFGGTLAVFPGAQGGPGPPISSATVQYVSGGASIGTVAALVVAETIFSAIPFGSRLPSWGGWSGSGVAGRAGQRGAEGNAGGAGGAVGSGAVPGLAGGGGGGGAGPGSAGAAGGAGGIGSTAAPTNGTIGASAAANSGAGGGGGGGGGTGGGTLGQGAAGGPGGTGQLTLAPIR